MEPQGQQDVNMDNLGLEIANILADDRCVFVFNVVFSIKQNLALIAKHCSVSTLKNFRLVSREWHDASLEMWRQKATIRINCWRSKTNEHAVSDGDFLRMFLRNNEDPLKLKQFPFRSYKLMISPSELASIGDFRSNQKRFLDVIGSEMKRVHFYRLSLDCMCNLAGIMQGLDKLKNTENIIFEECLFRLDFSGDRQPIPVCRTRMLKLVNVSENFQLKTVLKSFPMLQDLTVVNNRNTPWRSTDHRLRQLPHLYNALEEFRDTKGNSLQLKILDTLNYRQKLNGLKDARMLHLEQLSVTVRNEDEDELRKVMLAYTSTLKSLTLYRSTSSPSINAFPFHIQMNQVEELYLLGRVTTALNFLGFMPSLKKVVVDQLCIERSEDVPQEKRSALKSCDFVQNSCYLHLLVTMEYLLHLELDIKLAPESWELLNNIMPNLKVLKAVFDNKTFRLVCQQWPKLDTLKICFGSQVDEKGLTGRESWDDAALFPNLTDLRELGTFELLAYCGESNISDFSVYHAFMRMATLNTINICVSPNLTNAAEENLKRKVADVTIYRNYGWQQQHEYSNSKIHCCSIKFLV